MLSDPNIPALTFVSSSQLTTGVRSGTSSGIANGLRSTDLSGRSASASRMRGLLPASAGLPTEDALRKALPILTYLTEYFPDATLAEVAVSVAGNDQHNPGQPLHWAREKSKDQLNTAFRHLWDHKMGITKDTDGQYHLAKAIWRLKAELQLTIEAEQA